MVEGKAGESKVATSKTTSDQPVHRREHGDYRWDGVEQLPYKEDDRALFKSITRQVLFSDSELHGELRYFEVAAGGFSTLERHEHMHAVLILRGRGHCLIGGEVKSLETRDLVTVPALTWHQFRASKGEPLGIVRGSGAAHRRSRHRGVFGTTVGWAEPAKKPVRELS